MIISQPAPPPRSTSPGEAERQDHTRLRRRILYGRHYQDVVARIRKAIGNVRQEAWGCIDMTSNPVVRVYSQLAGLYRQTPEVEPPAGAEDAAAALAEAGYWTLMSRIQRDTLALREMVVRLDIDGEDDEARPVVRPVYPDLVEISVDPMRPRDPVAVKEWIEDPRDRSKWVRLICDTRGGGTYRAEDASGADVSKEVLGHEGGFTGEDYPWVIDGKPVLPYVVYHAADSGWMWDPFCDMEVVEGTLQLGVLYTFYSHIVRGAAWAQRYMLGAEPAGLSVKNGKQAAEVVTDPASLLMLQPMQGYDGQPAIGQWSTPVDPGKVLESVMRYEHRLVEMAVGGADVTKQSADIRSGYSLAVSREGQRSAQRSYEPLFRRSDLQMCKLVAGLLGQPTEGWRLRYHSIARDPAELAAEWETKSQLIAAGLLDPVTAYMELHAGMTRAEAERALEQIRQTRQRFNIGGTTK